MKQKNNNATKSNITSLSMFWVRSSCMRTSGNTGKRMFSLNKLKIFFDVDVCTVMLQKVKGYQTYLTVNEHLNLNCLNHSSIIYSFSKAFHYYSYINTVHHLHLATAGKTQDIIR